MIIRQMTQEDIKPLAEKFCFSWTTLNASVEKWERYNQAQNEEKRFVAVVEIDRELVGYGSLLRDTQYPYFKNANIPEINDLWIDEKYRSRRLATKLITFLENKARSEGCLQIGIGVGLYADYGKAQKLYGHLGYVLDGNGMTYKGNPVVAGESYPVDDELTIWFKKNL